MANTDLFAATGNLGNRTVTVIVTDSTDTNTFTMIALPGTFAMSGAFRALVPTQDHGDYLDAGLLEGEEQPGSVSYQCRMDADDFEALIAAAKDATSGGVRPYVQLTVDIADTPVAGAPGKTFTWAKAALVAYPSVSAESPGGGVNNVMTVSIEWQGMGEPVIADRAAV